MSRYVTSPESPERFRLFRLCDCLTCEGTDKAFPNRILRPGQHYQRCSDCRGEGRVRQELATCASPEAVGVAIVTLAREGEWTDENGDPCALGLLDSEGETGKRWLILPWKASARNVHDAAVTLARSKKSSARP